MSQSKGTRWVAVMVSLLGLGLVICLVGVTTIAAPKFMRFQDRSLQSECLTQLRAIATAERAHYAEFDRYTAKFSDLGLLVEQGPRYQYRVGPGAMGEEAIAAGGDGVDPAAYDAALPPAVRAKLGVQGTCPDCELTATCVGNLDDDDALDVWSVTVGVKKVGEVFNTVRGELIHHADDTQL